MRAMTSVPPPGLAGTISWTVENVGDVATDVSEWVDRIWLSTDATLDADDVLLADVARSGTLGSGESYEVSADILIPTGIEGTAHIFVVADGTQAVTEPDTRADNVDRESVSLSSPWSER